MLLEACYLIKNDMWHLLQGVWLRDWFIRVASYFTKVSFYTDWDAKLN